MARTERDARPLSLQAYDRISKDIIEGVFAPGSPLVQEQLAEAYGVSRTPIRDSLNRLVHEGLAELLPGSGYVVSDLTHTVIADVYEVRRGLERMAIEHFGAQYSPVDFARMEFLIVEGEHAARSDPAGQFRAARQFHGALVAPCTNLFLLQTLDAVWEHPVQRRIAQTYTEEPGRLARVSHEHRRIVETARRGDAAKMLELLEHCHRLDR